MISAKFRYALTLLMTIANGESCKPMTLAKVSEAQLVSEKYLEKIAKSLTESGVLKAFKGPGGGYVLNHESEHMTLYDIFVISNDGDLQITRCNEKKDAKGCALDGKKCFPHEVFDGLEKVIKNYLSNISLKNIINYNKCNQSLNFLYVDYNATAAHINNNVKSDVLKIISEPIYNPSSGYFMASRSRNVLFECEEEIFKNFKLPGDFRVIFLSSATEANNLMLSSNDVMFGICASEHPSIINALPEKSILLGVDSSGLLKIEDLENFLSSFQFDGQKIVSVSYVNNETGVIQDLKKIVNICKKYGCFVHSDFSQACGKIHVNVSNFDLDAITFSSHKFGGISGVGVLACKKNFPIHPVIKGGGQQNGLRAGTENILAISALKVALCEIDHHVEKIEQLRKVRDVFESVVLDICQNTVFWGQDVPRIANTSCCRMPGVHFSEQIAKFDLHSIGIGGGSACSFGKLDISNTLRAMGVSELDAQETARFSFAPDAKIVDALRVAEVWKKIFMSVYKGEK